MKRVSVFNLKDGRRFGAEMENPNDWISSQIAENSWGLPDRWIAGELLSQEEKDSAIDTRHTDYDTEYKLPSDYEIEIDDLSAEMIERKMADIRKKRDALLLECDWTQLSDAPLDMAEKIAWREYRQALRDVPQNIYDPAEHEPVWPEKPE